MPVRSLNSSILRWPSRDAVDAAFRQWVAQNMRTLDQPIAIGYFGSYARGNAGVGSDLDVVIVLESNNLPFARRSELWDFLSIPVPVEAQIYTAAEWAKLAVNQPRFYETLERETVWIKSPFTPTLNAANL